MDFLWQQLAHNLVRIFVGDSPCLLLNFLNLNLRCQGAHSSNDSRLQRCQDIHSMKEHPEAEHVRNSRI